MSEARRRPFWERLGETPGLFVTLAYLLVSLIGVAFSWALLREFGLNVFSFADVTDFLMAAFREPMTFVLSLSALALGLATHWLAGKEVRWLERRNPQSKFGRRYLAMARAGHAGGYYVLGIFLLYTIVFIASYAQNEAGDIRAGSGERVVLQAADQPAPIAGLLLGATSRFVFLYRQDLGQAEAIPQENILRIRPVTGPIGP